MSRLALEHKLIYFLGIDHSDIVEMFDDLQVPDLPKGVFNLARNLITMHAQAERLGLDNAMTLARYEPLARAVVDHLTAKRHTMADLEIPRGTQLLGLVTTHPLYTMLTCICPEEADADIFNGLKMMVLDQFRVHSKNMNVDVRAALASAAHSTRLLGGADDLEHLLTLDHVLTKPEEVLAWITETYGLITWAPTHWYQLALAIEVFIKGRERQRGHGGGRGGWRSIGGTWCSQDLMYGGDPGTAAFLKETGEERFAYPCDQTLDDIGAQDPELFDWYAIQSPRLPPLEDEPDLDHPPRADVQAAYRDRVLRLPLSSVTLTPGAIRILLREFVRVAAGAISDLKNELEAAALVALLSLSHGISFSHAQRAFSSLYAEVTPNRRDRYCAPITIDVERGELLIHLAKLRYFRQPPSPWRSDLNAVKPVLRLPLSPAVREALNRYSDPTHPVRVILAKYNLEPTARAIMRQLAQKTGAVISLGRLHYAYRDAVYRLGGDFADVVLLTGETDRDLTHQPTYTCRNIAALQDLHRAVMVQFADWAGDPVRPWTMPDPPKAPLAGDQQHVGSVRTPTRRAVKRLRQGLIEELNACRARGDQFRYHNVLTAYLVVCLTLATSSRAVSTRFARRSDFTADCSRVILSDKDGDAFLGARMLPILTGIAQLVKHYERESAALLEFLAGTQGATIDWIQAFRDGISNATSRREEFAERSRCIGFLYLLDENHMPCRVTMKRIEAICAPWFKPGLHTLRHYMRSELRDLDLRGGATDYLLGHGALLASPNHEFSLLRPQQLEQELLRAILAILTRDGWFNNTGWS